MDKKIIDRIVFGFIGILLLSLGGIFSFADIPSDASKENVYVSSQITTVTLDRNGDASVYQYIYYNVKNSSLKEIYIDLDYSKDSFMTDGLCKPSLDTEDLSFSFYSSADSFSFDSETNEHRTAGYKYAASYDTDNLTLKGSKVESGDDKARLYFGKTMDLGESFSVTLNYRIKAFASIFNDYTFLDMTSKPSSYPVKSYQFTLSLPFTPVDSSNFHYGINYKTKGNIKFSNSLFQIIGDDGYYDSGIRLSASFSSSLMNTKEDLDANGAIHIDKDVAPYLDFHIFLVQADWYFLFGLSVLALIIVLAFILTRSIYKKEKRKADITESIYKDNSSIDPLTFNLVSFDYKNFEDGLILYFLYNQKITSAFYKGSLIYLKPIEGISTLLGSSYLNIFSGKEVELSELRIRVVKHKKELLRNYKEESKISYKSLLSNSGGIFLVLGLAASISLMSLYSLSQRSLFIGCLSLVIMGLYVFFYRGRIFLSKHTRKAYTDKRVILNNLKDLSKSGDKALIDISKIEKYLCYFRFFDYSYYLDYIKNHNRDNSYLKNSSVNKKIRIIYNLLGIV